MGESSANLEAVDVGIDIESELDRFRQKLLDLSNVNRLLNYRKSRTRTIQIVDELPNQIFDRLVVKEKPFAFLSKDEDQGEKVPGGIMLFTDANGDLPKEEEEDHELPEHLEGQQVAKHHADDKLQTDLTEKRLDRILNTMRQEANAAVEETGVNYLYFALGMLEWTEREGSERTFLAPLILVPLRLERSFDARRNKYRTTVLYNGEDIQQNLCLAKRLESDFGLVLPEYRPDEDGNPLLPEDYFEAVSQALVDKPGWKVRREALIGFFSFRKLLMYLDLDPERWDGANSLKSHPLVKAVVEGTQIDDSPTFFSKDYEIDNYATAQHISLVKDADSSQHSALCDIAEGKSLVIEGPPGTGKSQTITNAIADALSDGKTVLFVAEKLAALEVVRNNLEKVGLGAFCLALHSEAANPRDVFADLGRRLDAQFPSTDELQSLHQRVEAQKKKLQLYLFACQLPAGPHGRPLYEVFWRIVELRSRGVEVLPKVTIDTGVEELQFDDAIARLNEVSAHVEELGPPLKRPWHGFYANRLSPSAHRTVAGVISSLSELAPTINTVATGLVESFGGKPDDWLGLAKNVEVSSLEQIVPPEDCEHSLIEYLDSVQACKTAHSIAAKVTELQAKRKQSSALVVGELTDAREAALEVAQQVAKAMPKVLASSSLAQLRSLLSQVHTGLQAINVFKRVTDGLQRLGFGEISTLRDYDQACFKYRLISHEAVAPPQTLNETLFFSNAASAFQRGRKSATSLVAATEILEETLYLNKAPDDDEIEELVDTLQAYGGSWTRFFRSRYRKAQKSLNRVKRATAGKIDAAGWIELLRQLGNYRAERQRYLEDSELKRVFGDSYQGLETDWSTIEVSLNWINTAKKAGLGYQQAAQLVGSRWSDSSAPPPGEVVAAGKLLRQELRQAEICQALGLRKEVVEVSPIEKIRSYLAQLAELLGKTAALHRTFTTSDAAPLTQLYDDATQIVTTLDELDALANRQEFLTAFPIHFRGLDTDTERLSATATWMESLLDLKIRPAAIERIAGDHSAEQAQELSSQLHAIREKLASWEQERDSLSQFGKLDPSWLSLPAGEEDPCLIKFLQVLQDDLVHLPPWGGFCRSLDRCKEEGLRDFSAEIYAGRLTAHQAALCYDLTLHEQLASSILDDSEPLRTFSRHGADRARQEFQELDRQLIQANQAAIGHAVAQRPVPTGVSTGLVGRLTELGLIRHETGKQRRHCRIRDLIFRAGRAVQGLKPCFMMSPLSIAQYLPAGSLEFDVVVMDEASQIKPEDALGTLIRAKQLVVVGDPKQLPPTSFFDRISESDEEEEATFLDDTESILEVALKAFPHKRRLRWHYRSQHESLIAFSNEKFYDGDLVVFPSPTTAAGRLGLRWHHIEDASFTGGCNPIEANVVAEAIARHAIERPDETLGVATFNAKQAQAIRDRLDELASNSSEVRLALERFHDHTDRLFVKNLENVQGDERDVIFVSYTYGPDPATKVVMNRFGPMTGEHGWRRLNVLVTRAKRRVEVFSSMKPSDIRGGPERSRGVNAMKDYLQYSMSGELVDRGSYSGREPDSPFEIAVARVIEGLGLKVVPQVGVAGFFVDLGILKPDSAGEFLLGVECDGATYHSSKSARDRDRLREEVIAARGWKLHRIWSTDWFLNQEAEEERLREAVSRELAKEGYATESVAGSSG